MSAGAPVAEKGAVGADLGPNRVQSSQKGPICARSFWGKAPSFPGFLALSAVRARRKASNQKRGGAVSMRQRLQILTLPLGGSAA
jgi:hypothetical protein